MGRFRQWLGMVPAADVWATCPSAPCSGHYSMSVHGLVAPVHLPEPTRVRFVGDDRGTRYWKTEVVVTAMETLTSGGTRALGGLTPPAS